LQTRKTKLHLDLSNKKMKRKNPKSTKQDDSQPRHDGLEEQKDFKIEVVTTISGARQCCRLALFTPQKSLKLVVVGLTQRRG
jgi:hypothetical protein